jgi:hypothetical protein
MPWLCPTGRTAELRRNVPKQTEQVRVGRGHTAGSRPIRPTPGVGIVLAPSRPDADATDRFITRPTRASGAIVYRSRRRSSPISPNQDRQAMSLIESIHARQILDSRGNPTIECEVQLSDGSMAGPVSPAAPAPVFTRLGNFATATSPSSWGKGSPRRSPTSTGRWPTRWSG